MCVCVCACMPLHAMVRYMICFFINIYILCIHIFSLCISSHPAEFIYIYIHTLLVMTIWKGVIPNKQILFMKHHFFLHLKHSRQNVFELTQCHDAILRTYNWIVFHMLISVIITFPRKAHGCPGPQAPVPLTIFRSNSKFNQNLQCSGLKYILPITTKFCTRHDSYTVVTCARFRCDRFNIF